MSNLSLLFLIAALIAALFSFGLINSDIAVPARMVFAFAMLLFLATLAGDGSHRKLPRHAGQDRTTREERDRKQRTPVETAAHFGRTRRKANAEKESAKSRNSYSDVA